MTRPKLAARGSTWLLLGPLLTSLGCSGSQQSRELPQPPVARIESSPPGPTQTQSDSYPTFDAELSEYRNAHDLYRTALANPSTAPANFDRAPLNRRIEGGFPGRAFTRVRGYLYWNDAGPQATFNRPGCAFGALTLEGTPCPSAIVPPVELDEEHARELLAVLAREPVPETPKVCMCGGRSGPMHSFVLYDSNDVAVASVRINLGYHDLMTFPDVGRGEPGLSGISEEFMQWYPGFCKRTGMPLCFYWDSDGRERFFEEKRRLKISFADESPLQRITDAPLASLDAQARRLLCSHAQRNTFRRPMQQDYEFGLEAPSGERWIGSTLPWYECEKSFPNCQAMLSDVLPCELIALGGDPGFFKPETAHCKAQSACLWGFQVHE